MNILSGSAGDLVQLIIYLFASEGFVMEAIEMADKSKVTRAFIAHSTHKGAHYFAGVVDICQLYACTHTHTQSYTFCNFVNKRAHK